MSIFENVQTAITIRPQATAAATINGIAVDTEGYGDGMVVIDVGTTTGTPTSFTVTAKIQESADGSTGWTDVATEAINTITAVNKSAEIPLTIDSRPASLRYIRAVATVAFVGGSSPTIVVSGVVVLGTPDYAPTTNSKTGN